jgi:hypothetical protein
VTAYFWDRCILWYTGKREADKKRSLKDTCLLEIWEDVVIPFYCGIIFGHNLVHIFLSGCVSLFDQFIIWRFPVKATKSDQNYIFLTHPPSLLYFLFSISLCNCDY